VYEAFRKEHPEYNCRLALNTDSLELLNQVKNYGIAFDYVERVAELAGDLVAKIDVIRDTFFKINYKCDLVVDLDLTSPLRTVEDIYGVIDVALKNKEADGAFSVTKARRSPYFNQVKKDDDGFYRPVIKSEAIARQQVPEIFDMNASIYVFKPGFLQKSEKKLFEGKMMIYLMEDTAVLDIDDQRDKEMLEIISRYICGRK
jgi:CMP-N,N'-diacetyllegionaminic acid synthase